MLRRIMLSALLVSVAFALPALADDKAPWVHIKVIEDGGHGAKVDVNLPLSAVEVALDVAQDEAVVNGHLELDDCDISVSDMRRIWQELRDAGDADFITVEEDDERVHIYRKGDRVYVEVDDYDGEEKVRLQIPISVVDALFDTEEEDRLNIRAALAALQETTHGEVISVNDGDSHVTIWID